LGREWYDARMTKDEIEALGRLSRVALSDTEKESFPAEIDAILAYVSTVQTITDDITGAPTVGVVANVLRADEITNPSGAETDVLTAAFPTRLDNYLVVKKILSNDE